MIHEPGRAVHRVREYMGTNLPAAERLLKTTTTKEAKCGQTQHINHLEAASSRK
jgi:hypothetical protein